MTAPITPADAGDPGLPGIGRVLSPDEFDHAQMLTTAGLREAKYPTVPATVAALPREAAESTRTPVDAPPPQPQGLMARAFNALVNMVEHPIDTAVGIVTAPLKGAATFGQYGLQQMAKHFTPADYAAYKAQGGVGSGHDVTATEAGLGALQAAVPFVAGPATRLLSMAAAPAIGEGAASFLATTAVGAGAGTAYAPQDPAVGALLGGALGAAGHGIGAVVRARSAGEVPVVRELDQPAPELPPEARAVEQRFAERLAQPDAPDAYAALPETQGGKILNADYARELSPDYAASNESRAAFSQATHEPASAFIKQQYLDRLAEPAQGPVLLTGGGGGSGKSTILDGPAKPLVDQAEIVRDGTLSNADRAIQNIDEALSSGREVDVAYVDTPFQEAVRRVATRAAAEGRNVALEPLAEAHAGAQDAILKIAEHYADNPRVRIHVFDNGGAEPREIPLADLAARRYAQKGETVEQTAARLANETKKEVSNEVRSRSGSSDGSGPSGVPPEASNPAGNAGPARPDAAPELRQEGAVDPGSSAGAEPPLSPGGAQRTAAAPSPNEPPVVTAVRAHVARVVDAWRQIFAPANRSPEAKQAANILRATTGEMAAQYEQAAFKLDEFRRAIDPLPLEDKLGFIDAIEGGRAQATPLFADAATTIRATLDQAREQVQALGTGKLEHFIQDYFPHLWKDPERAADAFEAARAQIGGKRPMEGGKSFLKARTIPTTAEGIALGLEPVSTNPVDLVLLKLREMQRYVMAHQSLQEMQDADLVKYVRAGEQAPRGYARINDKIATVFGPREGAVSLPEGANIAPEEVGVPGMRIMGEYWAPEPVARVVNNYLSPGLRGNAIYDAYRGLGNSLNQAQLGLSAFHLGFTSMDATVSRTALGLEYLASGKPLEGIREILSGPLAPITNWRFGKKIQAAYLNPADASPDMLALANAVKEAGGRVRMDSFYENSAPKRIVDAWRAGEYGQVAKLSVPAVLEWTSDLIMKHVVPLQKLGVFGDLAEKVLADLPDEATLAERRAALAQAWDSVDNRMGQLVYDNLFWNKTFKDLAMASVRSVGWNIGTIRELGGGLTDLVSEGAKRAKGAPAELTHRAAYVAALPITVGMFGAVYQYLRTGEGPQELKDYFFPRTGEVDADGNPERVEIASYMKDFFAYAGHPWDTVKHKLNPVLSTVYEMLQNQDYYGDQIRNPNDPMVKQLGQEATWVAKQALPFSVQGMIESRKRDDGAATILGNALGVVAAPRDKVRSPAQNKMAEYLAERQMSGATPEDAAARQSRAEILAGLRGQSGVNLEQAVTNAIEHGQLTPPDLAKLMKRAGMTPAQERFKRLTAPQAIEVFKLASPKEQAIFVDLLLEKIDRMASR